MAEKNEEVKAVKTEDEKSEKTKAKKAELAQETKKEGKITPLEKAEAVKAEEKRGVEARKKLDSIPKMEKSRFKNQADFENFVKQSKKSKTVDLKDNDEVLRFFDKQLRKEGLRLKLTGKLTGVQLGILEARMKTRSLVEKREFDRSYKMPWQVKIVAPPQGKAKIVLYEKPKTSEAKRLANIESKIEKTNDWNRLVKETKKYGVDPVQLVGAYSHSKMKSYSIEDLGKGMFATQGVISSDEFVDLGTSDH